MKAWALAIFLASASLAVGARAADPPQGWCAPELETLDAEVCHHAEPPRDGRRTLVIFLHGLVKQDETWQHTQQRAMVRAAKRLGFSVIAPRGRVGLKQRENMVGWPTNAATQREHEQAVLAEWQAARATLEKRQGAPFDEVFVVGFSNGAYYASSLAMRGQLEVDGYAVFAGGTDYRPQADKAQRAPVYIAICGKDRTRTDARKLVRSLQKASWPHRAETRPVGHTMADAQLDRALAYLREAHHKRRAPPGGRGDR